MATISRRLMIRVFQVKFNSWLAPYLMFGFIDYKMPETSPQSIQILTILFVWELRKWVPCIVNFTVTFDRLVFIRFKWVYPKVSEQSASIWQRSFTRITMTRVTLTTNSEVITKTTNDASINTEKRERERERKWQGKRYERKWEEIL